ncbi:MAG: radical SAM protein [Deltaproteobacteria bacterium]|nr:radical SAM protein [Deltaproteobacteria bacterium]
MKKGSDSKTSSDKGRSLNGHLTVIFKALNLCNGDCCFCSARSENKGVVKEDDLPILVENLERLVAARRVKNLTFTFHGGEPSLLAPDLIDHICVEMRRVADHVSFNMQSNLVDVRDDFIDVVGRHSIRIGTSFDPLTGQRTVRGKDAYPKWRENLVRLVDSGISPGAIFVLNRGALGKEQRLYDISEEIGREIDRRFGLQINHLYPQGGAVECTDSFVTPEEFGDFCVNIWKIWEERKRSITLSPIQQFVHNIENKIPRPTNLSCSFTGECFKSHVGIDWNLNVSSCGRGLDSRSYCGNLRDLPLEEILENTPERRRAAIRDDVLQSGECRRCRYFALCHGGCPDDAMLGTGSSLRKAGMCEGYRKFFRAVEEKAGRVGRRRAEGKRPEKRPTKIEVVSPVVVPEEVAHLRGDTSRREVWIMPSREIDVLRFDSTLAAKVAPAPRVRIIIFNGEAKRLAMWEDLLRRKGVGVGLFEGEGLVDTVTLLGELRANIEIDAVSVMREKAGRRELRELIERFLFEESWGIPIWPFAHLLRNAVERREVPLGTRWGFLPDMRFEPSRRALRLDGKVGRIIRDLQNDLSKAPEDFFEIRKACMECEHRSFCGGCFAEGDDGRCLEPKFAGMIADAATEIRRRLKAAPGASRDQ